LCRRERINLGRRKKARVRLRGKEIIAYCEYCTDRIIGALPRQKFHPECKGKAEAEAEARRTNYIPE
jgi:hypothetical protein